MEYEQAPVASQKSIFQAVFEFMDKHTVKSDILLLVTAVIWGFAFVAQRVGMDFVGPFTFNSVRFALGSIVLLPFIAAAQLRRTTDNSTKGEMNHRKSMISGGTFAGVILFFGASLQQMGLVYTTAGNAGFITGLYVVMVPLLGLIWRHRPGIGTWLGTLLAAWGLYLLSVTESFHIAWGDLLVLMSAVMWATHVLIIGWLSPRLDPLILACTQFAVCSALSTVTALWIEPVTAEGLRGALIPILYGGVLSVGLAYTLQVVAQRHAPPAHAAVILSLEGAFAALGGRLLLAEQLTGRGYAGCALMLAGMLLSQLYRENTRTPGRGVR
jgi:drug/metabolite transporter (DMT)-like permease